MHKILACQCFVGGRGIHFRFTLARWKSDARVLSADQKLVQVCAFIRLIMGHAICGTPTTDHIYDSHSTFYYARCQKAVYSGANNSLHRCLGRDVWSPSQRQKKNHTKSRPCAHEGATVRSGENNDADAKDPIPVNGRRRYPHSQLPHSQLPRIRALSGPSPRPNSAC